MNIRYYLAGGIGNCLFQLNYCAHLRQQGFNVQIKTFMLLPNWIFKFVKWKSHEQTLDFLCNLGALADFEVAKGNIFDVVLLLLSKRFDLKSLGYRYIPTTENVNIYSPNATCIAGHPHHGITINKSFSLNLQNNIQNERQEDPPAQNVTVVHIRGGDFLTSDCHNMALGTGFYENAFRQCDDDIIIVTNDKDYARHLMSNFPYMKYNFSKASTVMQDFLYLAQSSRVILSNSTFSWWAAELSNAKIIYEPNSYYPHIEWRPTSLKLRITFDG